MCIHPKHRQVQVAAAPPATCPTATEASPPPNSLSSLFIRRRITAKAENSRPMRRNNAALAVYTSSAFTRATGFVSKRFGTILLSRTANRLAPNSVSFRHFFDRNPRAAYCRGGDFVSGSFFSLRDVRGEHRLRKKPCPNAVVHFLNYCT